MSLIDKILTDLRTNELALKLAADRQKIIAANLANIETPGYRAKDIKFYDFLRESEKNNPNQLVKTSPMHLSVDSKKTSRYISEDLSGPEKPDGNNVDLDIQMSRLHFTKGYFQTAAYFMKARYQMVLNALRNI